MSRWPGLAALLLLSCNGRDVAPAKISLTNGWAREAAPGQSVAAAYVTISNQGDGGDRLVGVETPVAAEATLHSSTNSGGVARMRPVFEGVEVPAGSTVELKPGGIHIMLAGLKKPLRGGQTIEMTFRFVKSGNAAAAVRVVAASAAGGHEGTAK